MAASPRSRILAYVLAAAVLTGAVWALAVAFVKDNDKQQIQASAQAAERLAVFFERQTQSIFRYGDAYLKMLRRTYSTNPDLEAVRLVMADVPLDTSIVSHITIIDADGLPVFNSGYRIRPGASAADRDYFLHERDRDNAAEDILYVSLPHRGRNSDKLIVRLVRRINLPDGRFGGVIFAALDAASVTEFFQAMSLGKGSSATLVGLDKRIRARSSYGRLGPGQDISGSRIWKELEHSPQGLYRQTSVVDGVTRNYAYRRLAEFPLVVAIGVAVDDFSGVASRARKNAYMLAGLATLLFVVVTVLLARQVLANERIRRSESELLVMRDQLEVRVAERTAALESVQEELIRAERLAVLGQLTGTVAHELRNPLSTIDTSVSVLERRLYTSDETLVRVFQRIHRNVERCNTIITDLLDFTRVERVDPESTPLDAWLNEVFAELAQDDNVNLRFTPGAPEAVTPVDRDRIRRVLINLVDNARQAIAGAGDEGGLIEVSTRVENAQAVVEIVDDGPGIPDEVIGRIREPLFSTKSFGIGLGLSVVDQIMTAHGGHFDIESPAGGGTRARLWLPLERA